MILSAAPSVGAAPRGFLALLASRARAWGRLLRLGGVVLAALACFLREKVRGPGCLSPSRRAAWLQGLCRRALPVLGVTLVVSGPRPRRGLLVGNHLSYLDILVLGAQAPCLFVAKSEVRQWPVVGGLAALAGTLFIRRDRRSDVRRAGNAVRDALRNGMLVVLFAEGTTSAGETVLPFKASLMEPAVGAGCDLWAAGLHYHLAEGHAGEEVCYWGDMTLGPHLLRLMGQPRIEAWLRTAAVPNEAPDRKALSFRLHEEVTQLHRRCKDQVVYPTNPRRPCLSMADANTAQ